MTIEIKNKEFLPLLNMINGFTNAQLTCKGLRNENVSLGVKVRLAKIEKILVANFKDFEDVKKTKIAELYPDGVTQEIEKQAIEDKDPAYLSLIAELNECGEEEVTCTFDAISFSKIEDIVSDFDYTYLIEKIAE